MSKPDDRRDNAAKIKQNIDATRRNIEAAEELISLTSDGKAKQDLQAKNERRRDAIPGMQQEMRDEIEHEQRS